MNYKFLDALEVSPVIAAVKDDEGVDACLKSESQVVFILYGDICTCLLYTSQPECGKYR